MYMINRDQRLCGHLAKPQYDNHTASDENVFKPAKKHLPQKKVREETPND